MKEITIEKMQELMDNQEFATKVRAAKSASELVKIMAEYDIQISEEELKESFRETVNLLRENGYLDGEELTERGLELVAGGFNWGNFGGGVGLMASAFSISCPPAALLVLGAGATWAIVGALGK